MLRARCESVVEGAWLKDGQELSLRVSRWTRAARGWRLTTASGWTIAGI
jgi:hypothetical protein